MLLDPFSVQLLAEQRMRNAWRATERSRLAEVARGPRRPPWIPDTEAAVQDWRVAEAKGAGLLRSARDREPTRLAWGLAKGIAELLSHRYRSTGRG